MQINWCTILNIKIYWRVPTHCDEITNDYEYNIHYMYTTNKLPFINQNIEPILFKFICK